jgi:Domain of unknown function (DUF4440)
VIRTRTWNAIHLIRRIAFQVPALITRAQESKVQHWSAIGSSSRLGESLRCQPVIECLDPVVAAGVLFSHAEAMAAGAENVDLGFVARRLEGVPFARRGYPPDGNGNRAVVTNPLNKFVNKQEVVGLIESNILAFSSYDRQVEYIRIYGDTAIVAGGETVVWAGKMPNAGKMSHLRFTAVWMKQNGRR